MEMPSKALGMKMLLIHDGIQKVIPSEVALCVNQAMETLLQHTFNAPINDTDYMAVSHSVEQTLQNAFASMQQVGSFPAELFSVALEALCEAHCNLQTGRTAAAVLK